MDQAKDNYTRKRITHWDNQVTQKENPERLGRHYQELLHHYYRFLVHPGLKVLELGSGLGDLLAALRPARGIGIDCSGEMVSRASSRHPDLTFIKADVHDELEFSETFDVIILSDLVNDLWDVQEVFERVKKYCHSGTRVILNFYNNLWRFPLGIVKRLGLGCDVLEQNWFSPHDVVNLLDLSGFEAIDVNPRILFPLHVPFVSSFMNKFLVNFIPFQWFALTNMIIARPNFSFHERTSTPAPTVSVVVAARNEAGNIESIFKRVPRMGKETEIVFVEGNSTDNTYETIERTMKQFPEIKCKLFKQPGKGKGDAVRVGFERAEGDILMILDADLTVPPEDLPRFVDALVSGKGEFINGVRLVYPMEEEAMRFLNIIGNKFFSIAFSWLLGQPIKDTLCGTKVLYKRDYEMIASNRQYFGDFDPFGDFDLLFGAAKLNLKIAELPIRYRERIYGDTNISRWRHGWLLLKMVAFAARRIKFI
ncbi:MAG: glycosyltransferase [Desulfobacteraceae bacterium]|nr:MAG: glycosyltransferase [Desulfobacteraceae bacterium]